MQLRRPLAHPRGEARSDLQIVFALAVRLGLGDQFFGGDIEAAWRHQLAPSGITLEQLREHPEGVRLPLQTKHRKYLDRGFRTPTGKVELYSPAFAAAGYPPIPTYAEPSIGPLSRPDLTAEFPLVLTCAKSLFFCESQHRQVASLRSVGSRAAGRGAPRDRCRPRDRGRGLGATVHAERQRPREGEAERESGPERRRRPARLVAGVPRTRDADGYPPFGDDSANLNLVLDQGAERSGQRKLATARVTLRTRTYPS